MLDWMPLPAFRRTVTLASVALALVAIAEHAEARDRPGTPNEVWVGVPERPLDRKPRLLVTFRNTASEKVHFWVEWTHDGEAQPSDFRERASCPGPGVEVRVCAQPYLFAPGPGTMRGQPTTDTREHAFALYVNDVDFDAEYCFRFMAQDEDGVISEIWSAWACTRTPAAPAPPGKPGDPRLTLLPGKSGEGEVGGPQPHRILAEWTGAPGEVASYHVQLLTAGGWARTSEAVRADASPLETTMTTSELPTLAKPQRYRVCAENISGVACSDGVSTGEYAAEQKLDPDLVVKQPDPAADTKIDSDLVVAPPAEPVIRPAPQPAPTEAPPPPPAPPAAEGFKRGPYTSP
jgi:hypothetical protein